MINFTKNTVTRTFVLVIRALRIWLRVAGLRWTPGRLGIAGRLAISFSAVAVLAIVANLIVEGTVSRIIEVTVERAAPVAPVPAGVSPAAKTVRPAAKTVTPAP